MKQNTKKTIEGILVGLAGLYIIYVSLTAPIMPSPSNPLAPLIRTGIILGAVVAGIGFNMITKKKR